MTFTPLPLTRIDTLSAAAFGLLRCRYRVDDRWYSLDCDVSVSEFSPGARGELEAALRRLAEPLSESARRRTGAPPARIFELNVRDTWIFDLEIADDGFGRPLAVEWVGEESSRRVHSDAVHLSRELRRHALEILLRSGERPRRAPDWHPFALARLIEPADAGGGRGTAARELYAKLVVRLLDAPPAARASRLAALMVPSVDLLSEDEVQALLDADGIVPRALPLTRKALDGDRDALYEIFRLAMEYGGDPAVFVAAARRLFPAGINPAFVARHPPARDDDQALLVLATVRRTLDGAEYVREPEGAWRLPAE